MFLMRSKHWKIFLIVYVGLTCLIYLLAFTDDEDPDTIQVKNYFQKEYGEPLRKEWLINTAKCQIPSFELWNDDTREARESYRNISIYKRCKRNPRVTYVENDKLIINETALERLNLSLKSVSCCYWSIERIDQYYTDHDLNADNGFGFSAKCHKMGESTTITSRFIFVNCFRRSFGGKDLKIHFNRPSFYRQFHAIPLLPSLNDNQVKVSPFRDSEGPKGKSTPKPPLDSYWKSSLSIRKKLRFWKSCFGWNFEEIKKNGKEICNRVLKDGPLPHVLIVGIDSTSRMNFHRFMNKSVHKLKEIGAVEMNGYSKVGPNTIHNFLPLMTSHSLQESRKNCSSTNSFDLCNFLWKRFGKHYITAYLEDSPALSIFNHKRTGFIKSPTDFYMRPFMLAAYREHRGMRFAKGTTLDCIGYERPEEIVLNFAQDLIKVAEAKKTPTFIVTWLRDLAPKHNAIHVMDGKLSRMITNLETSGFLDKTLLIVMSDHGYRSESFRRTLTGWYEEKLPAFWIRLPKMFEKRQNFRDALNHNSKQLVTAYDIHATLEHVLILNKNFSYEENVKVVNASGSEGTGMPTGKKAKGRPPPVQVKKGISLLTTIPPRSCKEALIPPEHCPCNLDLNTDVGPRTLKKAIQVASATLNILLPKQCLRQDLNHVVGTAVLVSPKNLNSSKGGDKRALMPGDIVILLSVSKPGEAVIESGVQYTFSRPTMFRNTSYFSRTNLKNDNSLCIHPNDPMFLFCVCDQSFTGINDLTDPEQ